jgi:ectoine hydroxylase-related dioxygenase (phytanoyl-CoA dioxygenase family)
VELPRLDSESSPNAWRDHDPPGSFLNDDQLAMFNAAGYCLVEGAIDGNLLGSVEHEIDRLERVRNDWLRQQPARRSWISHADIVDYAPNLVARSRLLADFSRSSPLIDICRDLVGPDARLYFDQAVYKRPTTSAATLPLHQDNGYNFKRPEAYITIWIPLHDVEPENGCLRVVPGIHRLGTLQHQVTKDGFFVCAVDPREATAVPARAGDFVVLSSLAPHATSGNRSAQTRKAYLLSYVPDDTCLRDGTKCNAPDTQFPVLSDGRAVTT